MDRKIVSCCPSKAIAHRGAIGGKAGKTAVLPGFFKIEYSSGAVQPCYRGLIWLGRACRAGGAPVKKLENSGHSVIYEDL